MLLIAYQLLTEHVQRLRRWSSPWANVIINLIDTVFWAAIMYMLLMANLQRCTSAPFSGNMSCILYFGILVLVVIIMLVTVLSPRGTDVSRVDLADPSAAAAADLHSMLSVIITGLCTQTLMAIRREKKMKADGAFGGNSSKEYIHLGAAGSASPMGVSDPIRLMQYPPATPRHL